MKRIAALLIVLLGSVSFSAANTITLDNGEGKMFGFATFPSNQFIFTAPHAYIEVETGPFGLLAIGPTPQVSRTAYPAILAQTSPCFTIPVTQV